MTFCGAVHAIVHAGLEPVLVDVDPDTLIPTAATTAAAARGGAPPEAMVVMHMAGYPAPVEELAEAAGLPLGRVIEDAAHALGTYVGHRRVGTISAATCFSFYATKNLPIGEGGMITTSDPGRRSPRSAGRLHGMSRDAWKRYLPGLGLALRGRDARPEGEHDRRPGRDRPGAAGPPRRRGRSAAR